MSRRRTLQDRVASRARRAAQPDVESVERLRELEANPGAGAILTGGDLDEDWERAASSGDEAVGGSVATPDQNDLTQWLHALRQVYRQTGQLIFHTWAVELAQAAHAAFVRSDMPRGAPRMVWKMSIDLDRVLVPSTGQHDPLDAWIAYLDLRSAAVEAGSAAGSVTLAREIQEAAALCQGGAWATDDPLGLGALLIAAYRLAALKGRPGAQGGEELLGRVVAAAEAGLALYARGGPPAEPASRRLAFRELGLAIGLHALERMMARRERFPTPLANLARYLPLAKRIDDFWCAADSRQGPTWRAHGDINAVMLATSVAPDGYLGSA
jgi:hypothetical protein